MKAPLPSKLGPCRNHELGCGKFCCICGHTGGAHTGEVSPERLAAEERMAARREAK